MSETTNYNLPLPHADNPLSADVLRLRASLTEIDTILKRLDDAGAAPIAALEAQVNAMSATVANIAELTPYLTFTPAELSVQYDTDNETILKTTEIVNGQSSVTDNAYDADANITHYDVTWDGVKTRYTNNRDLVTGKILGHSREVVE
ncbi:MAG: hypothetical protein ACK5LJ_11535 [Paracoccus sp. (in: a-proteobacteria)]